MTTTEPSTALATRVPIALSVFGEDRLTLLKEQIGRGWKEPMTDAELEHIGLVCQRSRLDPLVKPPQIYFIKRWDSRLRKEVMTPQVSIDGLRLIAQRSRAYGGATPYLYCGADGVWREFWDEDAPPRAAKVGVKRRGWTDWLWATATWKEWAQYVDEYDRQGNKTGKQQLAPFWKTKPAHMLGKTAEGIALKRAFPEETNDLELAAVDLEWRQQQIALAGRYTEVFGADHDNTAFADLPPQRALNAAGDAVDTTSGEVIEDRSADPPAAELEGRTEAPPASVRRPSRSDLWQENRRLTNKAAELGIQGVPVLPQRSGEDVIAQANDDLAGRIRAWEAGIEGQPEQEAF